MKNSAAALLLVFSILPSTVFADGFLVERKVAGTKFGGPVVVERVGFSGNQTNNPPAFAGARRPDPEASVTLKVEQEKARRDEPHVSYILRKDLSKLLVLFHESKLYCELQLPLEQQKISSGSYRSMGEYASELYELKLDGAVQKTTNADPPSTSFSATVANELGKRLSVQLDYAEESNEVPTVAKELELLVQALRFEGHNWLATLTDSPSLPSRWQETLHLPGGEQVEYSETTEKVTAAKFEGAEFEAPADYRKVGYEAPFLIRW